MPRTTPHTEETKQKIREANLGRQMSEQTRILMSLASRGKPKSEAHKQAIKDGKKRRRERIAAEKLSEEMYQDFVKLSEET